MNIEEVNSKFAIDGTLTFVAGDGGFIQAYVQNDAAEAVISTYGGQVLRYRPAGEPTDLLFLSSAAYYEEGKAIKGGIPVCWPWFGPDPDHRGRPAHGFVRNRQWTVLGAEALDGENTRLLLGVDSDEETRGLWPYDFELHIQIDIGSSLEIALRTVNKSAEIFQVSQALHSYFLLADVTKGRVYGLDGATFIDKVDGDREKVQDGPVVIAGEVDRIYSSVGTDLSIEDPILGRRIRIQSSGSRSVVVWNPWIEKAAVMGDIEPDEYKGMLCVETANAGPDIVTVNPGREFQLRARYSVMRE